MDKVGRGRAILGGIVAIGLVIGIFTLSVRPVDPSPHSALRLETARALAQSVDPPVTLIKPTCTSQMDPGGVLIAACVADVDNNGDQEVVVIQKQGSSGTVVQVVEDNGAVRANVRLPTPP
ncbi:MAG: hypothetical protein IPL40_13620 [Proteobacteria bacterium]|nr:hypothetical protein [Pseudomonadota bacterium]